MVDWGVGRYEETAAALEPVALSVVQFAGVGPGRRVLDIGCGTGNAALAAARAGADVTGVDPAVRLVEVAAERLRAEGLPGSVVVGDAQALPFPDASFDAVLSVFALIFAPNADQAIGEALRVLRPGGRAFVAVWVPAGAIDAMLAVYGRAVAEASGGAAPARFAWHDVATVREVATRHGAEVTASDGAVVFVGESPDAYFAAQEQNHPMAIASRPLLEHAGTYAGVREAAVGVLRAGNESTESFRATSPYRVLELYKLESSA